jgi:hypothetical protein
VISKLVSLVNHLTIVIVYIPGGLVIIYYPNFV